MNSSTGSAGPLSAPDPRMSLNSRCSDTAPLLYLSPTAEGYDIRDVGVRFGASAGSHPGVTQEPGESVMNVDLVQLAGHRGRLHERPTVDQVTAEVIRGAMETICFEMATYVSRTATTP